MGSQLILSSVHCSILSNMKLYISFILIAISLLGCKAAKYDCNQPRGRLGKTRLIATTKVQCTKVGPGKKDYLWLPLSTKGQLGAPSALHERLGPLPDVYCMNFYNMNGNQGQNFTNETFYCSNFLTWKVPESSADLTYWVTDSINGGLGHVFTLDYRRPVEISSLFMVNTHNGEKEDRATKEFTVSFSDYLDGPWRDPIKGYFKNPLGFDVGIDVKLKLREFKLRYKVLAQYVKFNMDSFFDLSGGLQFFAAYPGYNYRKLSAEN